MLPTMPTTATPSTFESLESNVRIYCRDYPATFHRAQGPYLFDIDGRRYIDFLSGAGALNYGHNHPVLAGAVVDYIKDGGVVHSLDLQTEAKAHFLRTLDRVVLQPRNLNYKVQFTGPTGTNAVEAALKLARKVTGRTSVVAFTNAFHGASLGSLAATASRSKRAAAGVPLEHIIRLPYDGFAEQEGDLNYVERMLLGPGNGHDLPAAIIVETLQGEGGLNVASAKWLRGIAHLARHLGALLIVDEIQTGCGRTGTFFDFERAHIEPDIVCLSKSLSGLGLPLSIVLIAPEHDKWSPGEHNGTFRGHNLAFVSGAAALGLWESESFTKSLQGTVDWLDQQLLSLLDRLDSSDFVLKGRGMLRGIEVNDRRLARTIKEQAFLSGLIFETCGPNDSVLKLMPPINIDQDALREGFGMFADILIESTLPATRVTAIGQ
jgi:diaminobutyrate-2-oxoglutarate transaminase